MTTNKISSYSRDELKEVLRILKVYRASLRQIGNRAVLSDSKSPHKKVLRIEHLSSIDKDFLESFSQSVCQKFFPEISSDTPKIFVENNKILGGIRIFYGDDMVDLSYQDFIHTLDSL